MMVEHTPGPWAVKAHMSIWITAGDLHVATIPRAADGDWSPANAHLIAAAPKLLSIVERLAAIDGGAWHAERYERERARLIADARAAIAAAKGTAS